MVAVADPPSLGASPVRRGWGRVTAPLRRHRVFVTALGLAAVLEDRERFAGRHVVTILCGGNVNLDAYRRWVGV